MPVGGRTKFRAIARVQPREETDEDLEDQGPTVCCRREGDTVVVARLGPGGEPAFESEQVFEFDRVFGSDSTYREIHSQELHFVVESALKGRDATLFVAGTSTCGKRHMVMGQPFLSAAEGGISGLAERIVGNLYMRDAREEWVLSVSMYSIFKETITDLLAPPGGGLQLSVVEDLHGNAVVLNLSDSSINNTADLLHLLRQSIQAREEIEEETNGRDGHSTLVLRISMQCVVGPDAATVHLVDLAGSDDLHLDDGLVPAAEEFDIVQHSLAMLGKVFSKMADGKEAIDYSGSTLTRLMKQYLEGASTVALLAVVSEQAASLSGVVEGLELAGKARAV
ncbi:P-loop containing nucleoside triphosphate hydrolase protein, partial [Pavlovales sp. CCMP2436]